MHDFKRTIITYKGYLLALLGVLALIPRFGRTPLAHRLLIPFFIVFLVWQKKDRLAKIPLERNWKGVLLLLTGLAISVAGAAHQNELWEPLGAALAAYGLGFIFLGSAMMRELAYPAAFLLFIVPWERYLIERYALPMQRFSAFSAWKLGCLSGFHPRLDDVYIILPRFTLYIEPACSGLQALMAMTAMTSLYAYYARTSITRRWLIFLLGVPLALFMNIARIWLLIVVGVLFGEKTALPFVHEYSAPILFIMLVFGLQLLKQKFERDAPLNPEPIVETPNETLTRA